ncbi:hypothetical protein FOL47_000191 [Perkinsus chesapeaki]|uniref:Uncharacterized protein n=1 Tax=Perkinsus chesapeaki TaxID=330153 RepID=A0A7J6MMA7_PERCH|nr:hypothetical protein FOL47_000191 [Perkinsus chesapeaki]
MRKIVAPSPEAWDSGITYDVVIDYMALAYRIHEVLSLDTTGQIIETASQTLLEHLFDTSSVTVSGGKLLLVGTQDIVDFDVLQALGFGNCDRTAEMIVCQKSARDVSNLTAWGFWSPCHLDGCRQSRVGLTNEGEWVKDKRYCLNGTHGCKIFDANPSAFFGDSTRNMDESVGIEADVSIQHHPGNRVRGRQESKDSVSVVINIENVDNGLGALPEQSGRSVVVETTDIIASEIEGVRELNRVVDGNISTASVHGKEQSALSSEMIQTEDLGRGELIEEFTGGEHRLDTDSLRLSENDENLGRNEALEETGGLKKIKESLHISAPEKAFIGEKRPVQVVPILIGNELKDNDTLLEEDTLITSTAHRHATSTINATEAAFTSMPREVSSNESHGLHGQRISGDVEHSTEETLETLQEALVEENEGVSNPARIDPIDISLHVDDTPAQTINVLEGPPLLTIEDGVVDLTTMGDMGLGRPAELEGEPSIDNEDTKSEELAYSSAAGLIHMHTFSKSAKENLEEASTDDITGKEYLEDGVDEASSDGIVIGADNPGNVGVSAREGSPTQDEYTEGEGFPDEQEMKSREVPSENNEGVGPLEGYEDLEAATDGCNGAPNGQCLDLFS